LNGTSTILQRMLDPIRKARLLGDFLLLAMSLKILTTIGRTPNDGFQNSNFPLKLSFIRGWKTTELSYLIHYWIHLHHCTLGCYPCTIIWLYHYDKHKIRKATHLFTLRTLGSGFWTTVFLATGAAYPGPPCPDRRDLESIDTLPNLPPSLRKLGTMETFFFPSFFRASAHWPQVGSSLFCCPSLAFSSPKERFSNILYNFSQNLQYLSTNNTKLLKFGQCSTIVPSWLRREGLHYGWFAINPRSTTVSKF